MLAVDHVAWTQARATFLQRVAPAASDWAPLVASGARTVAHVPSALLGAWQVFAADALDWVRREPEHARECLWMGLMPTLLLHTPCSAPADAPDRPRPPLSHKERAAAVMRGDFLAELADRNADVWCPGWVRPAATERRADRRGGRRAAAPTLSQRRALKLVRAGRPSAAARALVSDPPAPRSAAIWAKAAALFPDAATASATTAFVQAEFSADLAAAAAFGNSPTVPRAVPRDAVVDAICGAPKASSPGPSGLRPEYLWALSATRQDALVDIVLLLTSLAAVSRMPAMARHALAGANLLLLTNPGGVGADGLPRLRPIEIPEVLRKLAAMELARTVRTAAAELLAPAQPEVGVSSACERILHEVEAHLALHPEHAVAQLAFRNAFNLVSRDAAKAALTRALPVVGPYLEWGYGGGDAPTVYGWAVDPDDDAAPPPPCAGGDDDDDDDDDDRPPSPPPWRLTLPAERVAQQGDLLGPLLRAAALWLLLRRIRAAHADVLIGSFHHDDLAVGAPAALVRVMAAAGKVGALIDAELAPAKRVGWYPAGAPAPGGWSGEWAAEGVVPFCVPLGGAAFVDVAVDRLAADQRRLVGATADLSADELQSQLLLLRLCAGTRTNSWLRALPLAAGARLAAVVDLDAKAVFTRLVLDERDSPAVIQAGLERAELPLGAGRLSVGGRTSEVPAAGIAS